MLRWWVLSWVVLVSCKSDNSIGCGKTSMDPADLGPQPGFVPVANAPTGIEQVIIDGSGRPVVRARDGLHRYDGNGAWTTGPEMSTIRMFHGADREIFAVDAAGGIHRLAESTFAWMPLGSPPIDDVIGSDFVGGFVGIDRATHGLWRWMPGAATWMASPGSTLAAAPVEAIVTHVGFVYRTIGDGMLYRSDGATTVAVAALDGSTLADQPAHLVTDLDNNLYFGTCASDRVPGSFFVVKRDRMGWQLRGPSFDGFSTCASMQWMLDSSLMLFSSDPDEPSANNTAMFNMPISDGPTTQIFIYMDGNYAYVARDKTQVYGFRSDDVAPTFIESTF